MASDLRLDLAVNGTAATANTVATRWMGGRGMFCVPAATFGGGSVALQWKAPDGTFLTVKDINGSNASLTAAGTTTVELPPGEVKVLITTATGVYAYLYGTCVD